MRCFRTYEIAIDASTDSFGTPLLDIRIRVCLPSADLLPAHIVAMPMFESHTGLHMLDVVTEVMKSLDTSWKRKIIGVTTDGAPNMTGSRSGLATRIQNVASPGFMRVWCAAHQLNLALKRGLSSLPSADPQMGIGLDFFSVLNKLIAYFRRQSSFISEMKTKNLYYIAVRWWSLGQVTSWYQGYYDQICGHVGLKAPNFLPSKTWWLILSGLNCYLERFTITSDALQKSDLVLSSQQARLNMLVDDLLKMIEGSMNEEVAVLASNEIVLGDGCVSIGPFYAQISVVKEKLSTTSFFARTVVEEMREQEIMEATIAIASLFVTGAHAVALVGAQRNDQNGRMEASSPPCFPLQMTTLTPPQLGDLMIQQRDRLRLTVPSEVLNRSIGSDHESLCRLVATEPVLFDKLKKNGRPGTTFADAWSPLGLRFKYLRLLACGLAAVMPSSSGVECDFSRINYERNECRSRLTCLSLEGVLHAKQLKQVKKAFESSVAAE
jgi:hypothetical protein